ncbi:TonB-dependent receptor [Pelomonas sp. P7]|uniref:TonB-dependent receptor n=1 Tax=Pelomonas caseinilytica TaxID=2906763 RepID=A0ABS8XJZ8_9BURK|nr:TonB-dependent receptor [Pelomonas sp. P7]MCE4539161.1 TonB-dependent receptor [Pelomonas sp. P7]
MPTLHTPRSLVLRRSAVALAISLGFAGAAQAQSAEGSLFGQAKAGATVSIVNLDTGLQRQATVEAGGSFTFSKLPPGRYRVTSGGVTREVVVAIGSGTEVKLTVQEIERIEISGRAARSSIDVTSVESNTVFTAEQMRTIPVARNVDAVALLAPGAVKGDPGLGSGGLASFGGASVGENGYYINGFDVTNIRNFLSYANLPFDAVEQQQIKNGGYGAEYGRSLGGVVSVLTKRGGNEWKAGAAVYYAPDSFRTRDHNVADLDPEHPNSYTVFRNAWRKTDLSYTVYGGGPIIKDKLFVFALAEGRHDTEDRFRESTSTYQLENKPKGLLKLDWAITDNHSLEYTGITNKKKTTLTDYANAASYSTTHDGAGANSVQTEGADVNILKYTGSLTQDLTVSAMVGRVRNQQLTTTGARLAGQDCPVVLDTDTSEIGCWAKPFPGQPIRDPKAPPKDTDVRKAMRFDVEYVLGKHTLRGGYDAQTFDSVAGGGSDYSGGYYWRYFISASGTVNGVPNVVAPGGQYVRRRESTQTSGSYRVENTAVYLEDSWQMNRNWMLYGGLRSESFNNKNGDGISFVKKDNLLAPRLGFAWNVNGDSSLKVYGNLGRYYIPVASNTNIRATRGELFEQRFYTFTGRDPRTQAPLGLSAQDIGVPQIINDGKLPDPATVADTNLKPMNQDEFILGFQKALSREYTIGAKVIRRKINDGMDDFCGGYAQKNWALDNGYTDFDAGTLAPCMLLNPGRDVHLKMDLHSDGNLTAVTIPAKYFALAKYERTYNALELSLDKPFDGRWGFNATYTWSKSRGTAEGYVQSTLQQEDAGLTQDFDFGSFTDGSKGYLPNDRRHVLKAYGTFRVADDWRVGANLIVSSGRPISCIGFVPETVPDFVGPDGATGSGDYTSASSYYCVNPKTGKSELVPRGTRGRTPWTGQLDAQLAWTPKLGNGRLTLQVDIFNVLNSQRVTRVNEVADYSRATTSAIEGKVNPNYLSPTDFQEGRSFLFTGRYEF